MNKVYKVIFNRHTGERVVVSELTSSASKGERRVSVAGALAQVGLVAAASLGAVPSAYAQIAVACTAGTGGTMYGGAASCVNQVNATTTLANTLSTNVISLSTGVSSLSTGLSSLSTSTSTGISSLSTGVSTLSTSTSTGISSLSTGVFHLDGHQQPVDWCVESEYWRLQPQHRRFQSVYWGLQFEYRRVFIEHFDVDWHLQFVHRGVFAEHFHVNRYL